MVTQFAEDEKLRERLRETLTKQIKAVEPDVVFAHSLGTLLTYDLFLHPPQNRIIRDRYFITCGCQIGRSALRSLFGGRLETVAAREGSNWYNKTTMFWWFRSRFMPTISKPSRPRSSLWAWETMTRVEYIRHANAQNKVWREIAGLPRARVLLHSHRRPRANRNELPLLKMWEKSSPPLRLRLARRVVLFLSG